MPQQKPKDLDDANWRSEVNDFFRLIFLKRFGMHKEVLMVCGTRKKWWIQKVADDALGESRGFGPYGKKVSCI